MNSNVQWESGGGVGMMELVNIKITHVVDKIEWETFRLFMVSIEENVNCHIEEMTEVKIKEALNGI